MKRSALAARTALLLMLAGFSASPGLAATPTEIAACIAEVASDAVLYEIVVADRLPDGILVKRANDSMKTTCDQMRREGKAHADPRYLIDARQELMCKPALPGDQGNILFARQLGELIEALGARCTSSPLDLRRAPREFVRELEKMAPYQRASARVTADNQAYLAPYEAQRKDAEKAAAKRKRDGEAWMFRDGNR